jgi:hypothetical protein
MADIALVRDGLVTQVWRGMTLLEPAPEPKPEEGAPPTEPALLPEWPPVLTGTYDGILVETDELVVPGMTYVGGAFGPPPPPPIADVQSRALAAIQAAADARHRALSVGPEQDIRYLNKAEDVQLAQLGDAGAIARLTQEAETRGLTVQQLTALVSARRGMFKQLVADLEAARTAGLGAIKSAATADAVGMALAHATTTINQVGAAA